ncbi:MAG: hypothetical protein EON54_09905 [Alcaligenaceae bacterium]|nr:MAG: hypothetical protein EON54_09905 [Alcaligenaceae bacterium]
MSEATLIFPNMRGGCATVGGKVHALFRVNGRKPGLRSLIAERDRTDRVQGDETISTSNGRRAET